MNAHGIAPSQNQYDFAQCIIKQRGLEQTVFVEVLDYRERQGKAEYDKLVSVGMFDHVGLKNLPNYFVIVQRVPNPGGFF